MIDWWIKCEKNEIWIFVKNQQKNREKETTDGVWQNSDTNTHFARTQTVLHAKHSKWVFLITKEQKKNAQKTIWT